MARVLLVEDDRWQADCYSLWLRQEGHAVRHVTSAQGAIDALDGEASDVIVLDMLLPHASGIQLLHQLRSYADWMNIPVIVCSSAQPVGNVNLEAYGVIAALNKASLTPQVFREAIARATA